MPITDPEIFDIHRHQSWMDYRAWFEYREERDRIEREKKYAANDAIITSPVDKAV